MGRHTENRLKLPLKSKLVEAEHKVESKLAKTHPNGHIECIICKVALKSAALWKVHSNSKLHKERIMIAKQIKSTFQGGTVENKSKGSIKIPTQLDDKRAETSTSTKATKTQEQPKISATPTITASLPPPFPENIATATNNASTALPEKFFDDPVKDAKVRNTEYKDPQAEEWERFQREIREASSVSVAIIAGEQIESAFDRDIDEINDQMIHWSRYMNLEARKGVLRGIKEQQSDMQSSDENEDEDDETTTEFSDWRSKSFI
ncbi:zinc finger protein 830 [Eurosta solidaginis]|uniref:zinc finger protein 830 n=1 Tax=Eurosta solidaginis TaxID=178769 RepID=UPI003531561C